MRYLYIIIAALVLGIGFNVIGQKDRSLGLRRIPYRLEVTRDQLKLISALLHDYKKTKGAYPSNNESLKPIIPEVLENQRKYNLTDFSQQAYAFTRLRVRPSGLLSIWGEPFIYENRKGLPSSAFSHSVVDDDIERAYSIIVEDEIYIWSLSAQKQYNRYRLWDFRLRASYVAIIAISLVFIALFIRSSWLISRRSTRAFNLSWSVFSGLVVGLFFFFISAVSGVRTCYEMSFLWAREPKLTKDYIAIMQKYRDRGVISNQAYTKLLKALDEDNKYSWFSDNID